MAQLSTFTALGLFILVASAQQIGTTPEIHPELITRTCTKKHGCVARGTSVVLDAQWRNIVDLYTGQSCITPSGKLNPKICPTPEECGRRCALDGANYTATGVNAHRDSLTLHMYKHYRGQLENVQPQVYLLEGGDYAQLRLLNREVAFTVDASALPCGMNGAAYLVEMSPTGGRSALNPAGATYGTGYCDSECVASYAFVNGVANTGPGPRRGPCCNEMDLWEANARATQLTAHPCNLTGFYACTGAECALGDRGPCARSGCGFNPYGLGARRFYGRAGAVDTRAPFTVVTQFPADARGVLRAIRRLYVQHGRVVRNAEVALGPGGGGGTFDALSPGFCSATAPGWFERHGGLAQMGGALGRGMVLVLGIWNDPGDFNNWLDSGSAGPCGRNEGDPKKIAKNDPGTSVTFSDIRWGDIGSTYETRASSSAAVSLNGADIKGSITILFISLVASVILW